MSWLFLMPLQLAMAGVPDGVDIDDVDPWAEAAEAFREGPDGCWEFTGRISMGLRVDGGASAMGLGGMMDGDVEGRVTARIEDHVWTQFHYTLNAERQPWMVLRPMWGTVAKEAIQAVDEQGEPLPKVGPTDEERAQMRQRARAFNLRGNRDEEEPAIQMSTVEYVDWDEESQEVRLVQDVFVEGMGQGEATAVHRFPGGAPYVTAVDISLPKTVTLGRWPLQGKIRRAGVHLRGHPSGAEVLPLAQRVSAIAAFFGQTIAADSALYFESATPCVSARETPVAPDDGSTTEQSDDVPGASDDVEQGDGANQQNSEDTSPDASPPDGAQAG